MRLPILSVAMVLGLFSGCNKTQSETTPPPVQPEPVAATPPSAETPPPAAQPTPPVDPAAQAAEAQRQQFAAQTKQAEAEYQASAAKWTDDRRKAASDAVGKTYSSLDQALKVILPSPLRDPEDSARDGQRHPKETLKAFGLKPNMKVLEIGPGKGWYSEILAPTLAQKGVLAHLTYDAHSQDPVVAFVGRLTELLHQGKPELYAKVQKIPQVDMKQVQIGEPGTYDMIIVMRMLHNSHRFGMLDAQLKAFHDALKPGGILAVEQHRAAAGADPSQSANKGYLPEAWVVETIERAGFKLAKKSEVNANAKDTKDYEAGVWALPPTYAAGDKDREKYTAIGESDRMTLKFVKKK